MTGKSTIAALAAASAMTLGANAFGQWSDDPADNLIVGGGAGDQVQPKIVATSDGGSYIAWFDAPGGYDVRLQRLDAAGHPLWGDNGILVADRSFSSTQDYGLAVDAAGYALLAYRTDQLGDIRIAAQRVSPNGQLQWNDGVIFDDGVAFVAAPKITGADDGDVVVAWTHDSVVRLARLDAFGTDQWGTTVEIAATQGRSASLADLHASGDGSVIASYIAQGSFFEPRHLWAARIDANGDPMWSTAVFDDGSLQIGNFPAFVPDGSGGAVFAWYDTSGSLQCFVQRLLADGTEAFPHNGVAVSTNAANTRVSPRADFNPDSEEIFVFWMEQDAFQNQRGVSGQKIDAAGQRAWGDAGVEIVPLGSGDYLVSTTAIGDGAIVFYKESLGFGNDRIHAARLDSNGAFEWTPAVVDVSSTPAAKSRLSSMLIDADTAVLVWENGDIGSADVMVQNLNDDGSLGGQGGGFSLTVGGECPGLVELTAGGATPGGIVGFAYARNTGSVRIPGGPCAGLQLGLDATAQLAGTSRADATGTATLSRTVPAFACGRAFVQAVDVATCTASEVKLVE